VEFHLADLYECLCDAGPDAEALVAGRRRCSRAELDARANRLAHHLQAEGVQPGDHVGIYAYNRMEWVEALIACWKIRAAAVNVNYRYVTEELRYIWGNSDMVALVYERGFSDRVAELADEFPALRSYLVVEDGSEMEPGPGLAYEEALSRQSPERGFPPRSGDDHYLIYTGGTTGMPKGVLWRHEDFFRNVICAMQEQMDAPEEIAKKSEISNGNRSLTLSPLMHGGGQWPFLITLFNGGVALFPVSRSLDPHEVLTIIESEKVKMLSIIGDAMGRPIAEAKLASEVDTSSLALIVTGGAILTEPVRELLLRAFGKVFLTGGIGGSEIGTAARELGKADATQGPHFDLMASVAVLDDDLEPIPPGSDRVGRMARRGYIPIGYYKDEKKTAETFATDARGVRWVLPGDLARVEPDGAITLLGRGSQCINSGGEKIFAEEVENVVRMHPAVRLATVVGVPDPTWQQRVVALVELEDSSHALTLEDLQTHCRQHLAGYKIPRALLLTDIPRTPTGKADYRWAVKFAEEAAR
jgi:acyl-CoA synthetase (AMP-forming)/AMP-acid ligase II